ncbi:MAG: acyltransferase [Acidimicrobiales bacterium]|nr:acyltransferase [Acidimicrobiales bacterium]
MTIVAPSADAPVTEPVVSSAAGYRAHIDGVRAIAVYLVVLFHAGVARVSGGFIGVDVFFVLSGYLVTQLLLRDIEGHGGIRFARFYSRRFRRLLPAAFVALIITAAVYTAVASPAEALTARGGFRASFLYSANWYFIAKSSGYFGADAATNPVLHFWSLAVEEQFYLLWPLLLATLFWVTRRLANRQVAAVRVVVALGAVASLGWALSQRAGNPNRAYYGTDARAYQLLAGALIALSPGWLAALQRFGRWLRVALVVALVALAVLASSVLDVDAIVRGALVTVVAVALIVAVELAPGGLAKRMLSSESAAYLGRVSYGTYLWHWPVIVLAGRLFQMSSMSLAAVTCLLATGLAALSHQLLERPIRLSPLLDRHRRVVVVAGLAISVVAALVLIPAIVDRGTGSVGVAQADTRSGFTPVPASVDWKQALDEGYKNPDRCESTKFRVCTIVRGSGKHILLMGDSHADMLVAPFVAIARQQHLTLSVAIMGSCPWQRDIYGFIAKDPAVLKSCKGNKDAAYTSGIAAVHPDLILVSNSVVDETLVILPAGTPNTPQAKQQLLQRATTSSLQQLQRVATDVVIIEPIPITPVEKGGPGGVFAPRFNPLTCLSKAKVLEECRYTAPIIPTALEVFERKLAAKDPRLFSADFDKLVCPFLPICDPIVGGTIVKWDGQHLTHRYALTLAPKIEAFLRDNRLLGG